MSHILSFFQVCEIDPNLLQFTNLEELTISCNFISQLNSKNLPPNLKVSQSIISFKGIFTLDFEISVD